jgi:hypothetical protein
VVYIKAKNVDANTMAHFAQNGPMTTFTKTGVVSEIKVLTTDGWVIIR